MSRELRRVSAIDQVQRLIIQQRLNGGGGEGENGKFGTLSFGAKEERGEFATHPARIFDSETRNFASLRMQDVDMCRLD